MNKISTVLLMDKYKEKCDSIGVKYKQKYDKLLSLVNGYENQNIAVSNEQHKNMKQLFFHIKYGFFNSMRKA